jgi:hypothetical protein
MRKEHAGRKPRHRGAGLAKQKEKKLIKLKNVVYGPDAVKNSVIRVG